MLEKNTSNWHLAYPVFAICLFILFSLFIFHAHACAIQKLSFLCLNDFHAAVEPVKATWMQGRKMIGGAACVAGYVDHFRKRDPDLVWVVAGDMFI